MSTVLVHGAGGFVGGAILRAIDATPGLSPIACLRRPPKRTPPFAYRVCDATDTRGMAEAARGAAFAVNAVLGDGETMLSATRNFCAAARAAGLRRIVHISTMSVYGAAEGVVAEDAPLDPAGASRYGAAKIGCEAIVRRFMAEGGEAVILRPGIVYGPGGQQWVGRVGRLLRAGRIGDLGVQGDGFCNLIYHDDVGDAVVAALLNPDAAGAAINLAPVSPPTWNDFFVRLACAIGATPVRRIPARWLRLEAKLLAVPLQVARLVGARLGLRPGTLPEPIPPSLLALWRQRIALDPTRADRLLGISRTPFDRGLDSCADWLARAA